MGLGGDESGVGTARGSGPPDDDMGGSRKLLAQWNPTSTDEERREFYQQRLELFARLFFWIFVLILVWVNVMYLTFPDSRPEQWMANNYVAGIGLAVLVLVWRGVLCRRKLSNKALVNWDFVILELIALVLGVTSFLTVDKPANVTSVYVWTLLLVFTRVCVIPSSGKRTLTLSALAFAPMLISMFVINLSEDMYMGVPPGAFLIGFVAYSGFAAAMAGLGSQVIYGLRLRVRAAQQLGQYTLLDQIGAGGMGTVYRAQHAMLRRPTAIKLLEPERAGGAEALARFEREVQLTSELTHPNTVVIFDYGRTPDGVFYYAMEYLDGIDLEQLVHRYGPQPAGRVVAILEQICGALDEAHNRGLVHRDIKPGNVIVCRRGGVPDVAKVLDFGLVKDLESDGISGSNLLAGTPAYLAPEAITDPSGMGPSGDLYAIGALAYFLLTGKMVFAASTVVEMCMHHMQTDPEPPSTRTSNPIPAELEALILECLAKKPNNRPTSARAIRERLMAFDTGDDWAEAEANQWWTDYAGHEPERVGASEPSSMLIDLRSRTPSSEPAPPNDTLLGI
ncbi:MAG: serine/threonine protein kinase [Deltaproteobacteria bacterium]|nr:serine/threonine protein kinase [Deltaproteobacteria bacterium]